MQFDDDILPCLYLPWGMRNGNFYISAHNHVVTSSCSVTQWRTEEKRMEWNGYVIYLVLSIHELKEMEMSERDHVLFSNKTSYHSQYYPMTPQSAAAYR